MKRISFLLLIGIFLLVGTGLYGGYLFWQKSSLDGELKTVEKSLKEYQAKVLENENQQVVKAVNAKKTLDLIKADMIQWSKVIKDVIDVVPKDDDGVATVDILSYSGSSATDLSMNVKTLPDVEDPYGVVADFIKSFSESKVFADAFVPSISSGSDDKGRDILTFLFSSKIVKQSQNFEEAISGILEESIEIDAVDEVPDEAVLR